MTPPWLDPRIWIIGALVLIVGVGVGVYEVRLAALRGEVDQARAENVAQREANAALKVQLSELAGNRDKLTATIEEQNQRIEQLRADATAAETAANVRALRALEAGRAAARAVDAGPGPVELNSWLRAEFAP